MDSFFRPEIAVDKFLPIFIESSMVLVMGVIYAAIITLAKMGYLSKRWMPLGYIAWMAQSYFLYDFALLIQSNHFTIKVLMVAMIAYLFVPHLYFYLISLADDRYEDNDTQQSKSNPKDASAQDAITSNH